MSSGASTPVVRIAQASLEPLLGGITLAGLAALFPQPGIEPHPATARCSFRCSQGCGTWIEGTYFFSHITACDQCREKADKEEKIERARTYWEAICPQAYRETDKAHPGFPKVQYAATREWNGADSLFFLGPSGKGKSRLAVTLLKRCLVRFNAHVGILWSYDLKAVKTERDTKEWVKRWGRYDLLLIDDPLQGAADSRVMDALKDLIGYRMDWKRPNIFTSQIGGEDYAEQAAKFGKETKADKEVIAALLRRLRETCRVVRFDEAKQQQGEEQF